MTETGDAGGMCPSLLGNEDERITALVWAEAVTTALTDEARDERGRSDPVSTWLAKRQRRAAAQLRKARRSARLAGEMFEVRAWEGRLGGEKVWYVSIPALGVHAHVNARRAVELRARQLLASVGEPVASVDRITVVWTTARKEAVAIVLRRITAAIAALQLDDDDIAGILRSAERSLRQRKRTRPATQEDEPDGR